MAISFVQITNANTGAVTSQTVTLSSGTTAGSILVVCGYFSDTATNVVVSDGNSDTVTDSGLGVYDDVTETFKSYIKAFFATTTGTTTVKQTFSGGTTPATCGMYVYEIAGITSALFDKVLKVTGTATAVSSGTTGTLSAANEAAVGFGIVGSGAGFTLKGAAWTTGQGSTVGTNAGDGIDGNSNLSEHLVVSSNAALTGTGTVSTTNGWTMWCATVMSGAVVPPPPILGPGGTSIFRAKQFASMGRRQIYG